MTNSTPRPHPDANFAVFDVETTGFSATGSDRVIEIAVVLQSPHGEVLDEYVTLVNPARDAGPTHVHGIDDSELVDAPAFGDIAGELIERMRDATLVGHNVSFDMRFLRAEFARIGHMLPDLFSVCTVSMARKIGMEAPRTLSACCHRYGVDLFNAHSALDDVKATAELMFAMKGRGCDPLEVAKLQTGGGALTWPDFAVTGRHHLRTALA